MARNVIVIKKEEIVETYSTLTALCRAHSDFSYHYLKGLDFTFTYKGWTFTKSKINK